MPDDLPLITKIAVHFWWLIIVFLASWLVCYVLLVRLKPLGKIGWKRADYVWLALACLGLIGNASESRRLLVGNLLENQKSYTASSYKYFHLMSELAAGDGVCRPSVRSQYSPPDFDNIVREYNLACEFNKSFLRTLPAEIPPDFKRVSIDPKSNRPAVAYRPLQEYYEFIDKSFGSYVQAQTQLEWLMASQDRSDLEKTFGILSSPLLAIALALRFTKVTGEVRIERAAKKASQTP